MKIAGRVVVKRTAQDARSATRVVYQFSLRRHKSDSSGTRLTPLVVVTVGVLIAVATGRDTGVDKSLIAPLFQIAYGMVIGTACLFPGVVLAWFGITASFAVSAEGGGNTKLALSSAGTGIALIIGGLMRIGMTLQGPINYFEE